MAALQISFKEAPRHRANEVATPRVKCTLSPANDGPSVSKALSLTVAYLDTLV